MRRGIFGGTFNPAHKGHREALRAFILSARLDTVYVIPTFTPPHKDIPDKWADFEDRLEMCRLAFSDLDGICEIVFSDIEKQLFNETGEKSYTYMTVERLYKPQDTLCLYVGTDMFLTLDKWRNSDYLLSHVEVWVMPRGDKRDSEIPSFKEFLKEGFEGCIVEIINETPIDASSTEIRSGNLGLLPESVREYIDRKGLYDDV